jgi:tubulin epsilon
MPQSITLQIGQCGNQIASKFWSLALVEQSLNNSSGIYDESIATFFRNVDLKNYNQNVKGEIKGLRARGIMIDMEEGVLNRILKSDIAELYDTHQIISSNSGSGNNWAYGYHVYGSQYKDQLSDSIRKEAEFCDSLQSFITLQSTGGGTGSGLGSYVSELIQDEYPNVYKFSTAIVPSAIDDVVTSPYNRYIIPLLISVYFRYGSWVILAIAYYLSTMKL